MRIEIVAVGAGILVAIALLISKAKAEEEKERLTLNIGYDDINGCPPGVPITFTGNHTIEGKGIEGTNIYVVNVDTGEMNGPCATIIEGFYNIDADSPIVPNTYQYRAYTEHQLPL